MSRARVKRPWLAPFGFNISPIPSKKSQSRAPRQRLDSCLTSTVLEKGAGMKRCPSGQCWRSVGAHPTAPARQEAAYLLRSLRFSSNWQPKSRLRPTFGCFSEAAACGDRRPRRRLGAPAWFSFTARYWRAVFKTLFSCTQLNGRRRRRPSNALPKPLLRAKRDFQHPF